jgi:hypothetical protein
LGAGTQVPPKEWFFFCSSRFLAAGHHEEVSSIELTIQVLPSDSWAVSQDADQDVRAGGIWTSLK